MTTARTRSRFVEPAIADYALDHSSPSDEVQLELQSVTQGRAGRLAVMQIGDDQALFMEMLARAMGARHAVEVGTFTGSSALAVARGMGPEGRLLCCDISEEWTAIAREYWTKAGVADRIDLRIGPGLETLRSLSPADQFDLVFVDADKAGYLDYYEELVPRLRTRCGAGGSRPTRMTRTPMPSERSTTTSSRTVECESSCFRWETASPSSRRSPPAELAETTTLP